MKTNLTWHVAVTILAFCAATSVAVAEDATPSRAVDRYSQETVPMTTKESRFADTDRDQGQEQSRTRARTSVVTVKFKERQHIRLVDGRPVDRVGAALRGRNATALLDDLQRIGATWNPVFRQRERVLAEMRREAELYWKRDMDDLNLFMQLQLPAGYEPEEIVSSLNSLDEVLTAYVPGERVLLSPQKDYSVGNPQLITSLTSQNDLEYQGYLDAAVDSGVGARAAWKERGGTGHQVRVADIEYYIDFDHEDLPEDMLNTAYGTGIVISNKVSDMSHGTSVAGIIAGKDNGFGARGIASDARIYLSAMSRTNGPDSAGAILNAVEVLRRGDILLIEVGVDQGSPYGDSLPVESDLADFAAIQTAVGNGIVVIEGAGNSGVNLDDSLYADSSFAHQPFVVDELSPDSTIIDELFGQIVGFDPRNDSGAIFVCAGNSPVLEKVHFNNGIPPAAVDALARFRSDFSNFGYRCNVQAWGDAIVTTGAACDSIGNCIGNLHDELNWLYDYTNTFSGTSGASAIIAGVAASLQSIHKEHHGIALTSHEMRRLLMTHSRAQQGPDWIGPLPDMERAVNKIMATVPYVVDKPGMSCAVTPTGICVHMHIEGAGHVMYTLDGSLPKWEPWFFLEDQAPQIPDEYGTTGLWAEYPYSWSWSDGGGGACVAVDMQPGETTKVTAQKIIYYGGVPWDPARTIGSDYATVTYDSNCIETTVP